MFLAPLLEPLAFADLSCFCLMLEALGLGLIIGLIKGWVIGDAESIGGNVVIDFSGCSL